MATGYAKDDYQLYCIFVLVICMIHVRFASYYAIRASTDKETVK